MNRISEDSKLCEILNRYDPSENHEIYNDLINIENKTNNPDVIIPVIGTQGAGKSTLINALIGEDILPNEADETTCIPVEIRYGEEKIEVYHKNGKKEVIKGVKSELAKYVDNAYNPGNEKKVSYISISKEYNMLQNGAVIVDLPGVLSLTSENEETTKDYLKKINAAIVLLTTSPPIKASEAKFIKNMWRGINKIFFVQNVWDDNSVDEIQEGEEFNRKALSTISKEICVDFSDGILSINAYKAAKGAFDANKSMIKESNIKDLYDIINHFVDEYTNIIKEDYEKRVIKVLEASCLEIERRKQQSKMSKEELLDVLKSERKKFQDASDEMYELLFSIDEKLLSLKNRAKRFARDISEKKSELLKVDMYKTIEGGVVDGENLTKVFSDNQLLYGSEASDEAYNELLKYNDELQESFDELLQLMEKERMESPETEGFYKTKAVKWENAVKAGTDIGGAVGGSILGYIAGGAAAGAWGGPAGVAVGIAVSIVTFFAASLIGNGIKKGKMNQRAEEAKEQIKPYINSFKENIYNAISKSFVSYFDSISDVIISLKKSREDYLDEINNRISVIMQNGNDIDLTIDALDSDLEYLKNWR